MCINTRFMYNSQNLFIIKEKTKIHLVILLIHLFLNHIYIFDICFISNPLILLFPHIEISLNFMFEFSYVF
jgi:hypothetical protein